MGGAPLITIHGSVFAGRKEFVWQIGEDSYAGAPAGFKISADIPGDVKNWQHSLNQRLNESGDNWLRPGQNGQWVVDLDAYRSSRGELLGEIEGKLKGVWEVWPQVSASRVHFDIKL